MILLMPFRRLAPYVHDPVGHELPKCDLEFQGGRVEAKPISIRKNRRGKPRRSTSEAGVGFLLLLPTQFGSNASLVGLSGACGDRSGDSGAFAYCTSVLLRLPGGYWASSRSIRDSLQYRLTLRFITNFFKLPTPRTQFISRFQPRPILSRRQVGGN